MLVKRSQSTRPEARMNSVTLGTRRMACCFGDFLETDSDEVFNLGAVRAILASLQRRRVLVFGKVIQTESFLKRVVA